MQAPTWILAAALTGLMSVPQSPQDEPIFPAPSAPIELLAEQASTFDDLLRDFCAATGLRVVVDQQTRQELSSIPVELYGDVQIMPDEIYPIVESMLATRGYVLVELGNRAPHVFKLLSSERQLVKPYARFVPDSELQTYADHPAVMIETSLTFEYLDVRQLTNTLRSLLVHQNLQSAVPIGERSMVLVGTGRQVASMAGFLAEIDAAEAAAWKAFQEGGGDGADD